MADEPTFITNENLTAITEVKRNIEQPVDDHFRTVFKIPKVIALKTLLDAHSRGNNFSTPGEPGMVDSELKEMQQKKKRRGLII